MDPSYALVVGSSSGLGQGICQYLLEEGYIVFGASRTPSDIEDENFIDLEVDVTEEETVEKLFESVSEETEKIHLYVNMAGLFEIAPIEDIESETFLEHLKTYPLGHFHLLKHLSPFLSPQESHLIHVLSQASKQGFRETSAYCASQFALWGLLKSVKKEWKNREIKFSNLVSGAVDTPMWEEISEDFDRFHMLDVDEFLHVFDMVVKSPEKVSFEEISFQSRLGESS